MAIPITPSDDMSCDIQVLDDGIRVVTHDQPRQSKHIGSHRVEVLIANFFAALHVGHPLRPSRSGNPWSAAFGGRKNHCLTFQPWEAAS